jgi:hypothetical protein
MLRLILMLVLLALGACDQSAYVQYGHRPDGSRFRVYPATSLVFDTYK